MTTMTPMAPTAPAMRPARMDRAEGGADGAFFEHGDLGGQGAGTQHHGEILASSVVNEPVMEALRR